jgi:predicted nucleic acid-binding protein
VTVFIDTSAFYAVLDADDQSHSEAVREWNHFLDEEAVLLTTNYILVETSALLQSRIGSERSTRTSCRASPSIGSPKHPTLRLSRQH